MSIPKLRWTQIAIFSLYTFTLFYFFTLIGDSKSPVGVNVSVDGCLSLYVSPEMNWWLVQGVQPPREPLQDKQ